MAVHLTRIYTKTGDDGTTALGDMSRVRKTDPRLVAYADVDEANSAIGVAIALGGLPEDITDPAAPDPERPVRRRRRPLHAVDPDPKYPPLRVLPEYTARLEEACDPYNERLTKLSSFILPGGTPVRRCCTWRAPSSAGPSGPCGRCSRHDPERTSKEPALYLNRLSDLLFILSRVANPDGDVLWKPGGER